MFAAQILTLLATTIAGQSEFSTNSRTLESLEPIFRKTEIATFTYKNRLLRVWASNSNRYDIPTSQWQFRYDPLLIPVTDDQGQVVTTEQFGDSWRTSFDLVLDDEAARSLAFDSVRQAYKNMEGILPSNMFAIPMKSIAIRIPDLTSFHPEVSLLGHQPCPPETACYPFHGPVSSVRVTVSSPSRTAADEIESLVPKCQIYFEIKRSGFRKQISSSPVTVTFQSLRESYFYTELRVKHSADYVSKFVLRRILQISRKTLGRDLKAEEAEEFDSGILEQLWKRWTVVSSEDFKPGMWTQTYNAGQSRADVLSDALNDILIFNKRDEKFTVNLNSAKNHDLFLFSIDGYANKRFTESELKRYLEDNGICIGFRSNKIIVWTLDFVKIDWSELTDPDTLSQPLFIYLPFQVEKESGFVDFSSFRAKRSVLSTPNLLEKRVNQLWEDNKDLKKRLKSLETSFKKTDNTVVANLNLPDRMYDPVNITNTTHAFENKMNKVPVLTRNLSTSVEDSKDLKERLSKNEDNVFAIFKRLENLEASFKNISNIMGANQNFLLDIVKVSANLTKRMYAFEKTINEVSVLIKNISASVDKLSVSTEIRLKNLNLTVTSELSDNKMLLSNSLESFTKIVQAFEKTLEKESVLTGNLSTSVEKLSMSTETRLAEIYLTVTSELRDKKSVVFQLLETVFEIENWLCKPEWELFCTSERCSCYKITFSDMNWHQALDYCRRQGGDLASIHSYEESEFIRKNSFKVWIGLNDATTQGSFKWSDGSPLDFTNWDPLMVKGKNEGKDAEDFVFISDVTGKWLVGKSSKGAEFSSVCQEQINVERIRSSESFMKELSIKWTNRQILNLGKALENSVCKRGWNLYCDSTSCNCYFLEREKRSWSDALSNCQSLGSDLVSLHSYDETRFFRKLLMVGGRINVWIGLTKKGCEDKFTWSDGTPMDFLHWFPSEPDDKCYAHCGYVFSDKWFSMPCEFNSSSVCKMKIPKTP